MNRTGLNTLIDSLSLVVFTSMVSTGLLLKFILPPGSGRIERLMRPGGRRQGVEVLWGLTRHEWGEIHFYLSLAFLVLLVVHIALHWDWIKSVFWKTPQTQRPVSRKISAVLILITVALILLLPWILPKKTITQHDDLRQNVESSP